jgi:uncharacterized membrane protein
MRAVLALAFIWLALLISASILMARQAPTLTPLQERDVRIGLLTKTVVELQAQLDTLRHDCNALQLQLELEKRTPAPKDGYVWSWTLKPDGQPEGYVKAKDDKSVP